MKKIAVVVGSPNAEKSFTLQLAADFIELVQARTDVATDVISLAACKIGPCRGCYGCIETGECLIEDDLAAVQSRVLSADLLILTSPVHANHVTAQTKALVDRRFVWGHALQMLGKPAITAVTAVYSDMTPTESYLDWILCAFGAIPVGHLQRRRHQPFMPMAMQPEAVALADHVAAILSGVEKAQATAGNRDYFEQIKHVLPGIPAGYAQRRWSDNGWFDKNFDQAVAALP